jgi:iron(III) transport system substrate-binding protein
MAIFRLITLILVMAIGLAACAPQAGSDDPPDKNGQPSGRLIVYSGRSEPLIQPALAAFQDKYPQIEILLKSGSNSELANALLEEQNNPQADIFITTELFTIQTLNNAGIFQSYLPDGADQLPLQAIGLNNGWVGLTYRARVIMYNTDLVSPDEAPQSIFDLTDPKWKGQVAAAGSSNGSMQAQIAALRLLIGEEATEEWLNGLITNNVTFFGGHTDVRKAVGTGEFKIGLVNHYYYHLQKEEGSPVGIVYPDQGTGQIGLITNLTAAGIIEDSRNPAAAQALIDFLISSEGQKLFSETNYEYPVLAGVGLQPEVLALDQFRQADVNLAQASMSLNETFAIMDRAGLP